MTYFVWTENWMRRYYLWAIHTQLYWKSLIRLHKTGPEFGFNLDKGNLLTTNAWEPLLTKIRKQWITSSESLVFGLLLTLVPIPSLLNLLYLSACHLPYQNHPGFSLLSSCKHSSLTTCSSLMVIGFFYFSSIQPTKTSWPSLSSLPYLSGSH